MGSKNGNEYSIRFAVPQDAGLILEFIKGLAEYEKMADEVVATEKGILESVFEKKQAEVLIAETEGEPAGFALFFHNYSTFLGKANLYLEDIFVKPEHRGKGIGKGLLQKLAQIAVERDCGRMDWWCLDWNESSIQFYKNLGAVAMDEWTVYRLQGGALKKMAKGAE